MFIFNISNECAIYGKKKSLSDIENNAIYWYKKLIFWYKEKRLHNIYNLISDINRKIPPPPPWTIGEICSQANEPKMGFYIRNTVCLHTWSINSFSIY